MFPPGEYNERLRRARQSLQQRGLRLLVVTDPANICYLTGYNAWSFYVHQALLLPADEHEPVWIGRGMDGNAARVTTYLSDAAIVEYPDDYVQAQDKHPFDFIAQEIRNRSWQTGPIGLEQDNFYFTASAFHALVKALPNSRFEDATALINWVRVIKSPAEIDFMQRAAKLAERAMQAGYETLQAGVRQCEVVASIYAAQLAGDPEFAGDYTAIVPMLPTGRATATPHITWNDETFKQGDATILELCGCYRRYHCPMARTVQLGTPPRKLRDTAKIVIEGLNRAIEAAQPGVTCEAVEQAWRETITRYGIVKDSRIGYSTGLNYPPDWGERSLSLRPGDRTVLQENMTIHMIPGVWLDDWGIEISECLHITASGAQRFTHFPQELLVKN